MGTQYRSAIFYHDDEQKHLAEESKRKLETSGRFKKPIATEIVPVSEFYEAEVENDIDKLSARIEPILTVAIAGIVLVLVLGVFLPMWNLAEVAIK